MTPELVDGTLVVPSYRRGLADESSTSPTSTSRGLDCLVRRRADAPGRRYRRWRRGGRRLRKDDRRTEHAWFPVRTRAPTRCAVGPSAAPGRRTTERGTITVVPPRGRCSRLRQHSGATGDRAWSPAV